MLKKNKVTLFDGAIGTELIKYGQDSSGAINIINPDFVLNYHKSYVELGVDIITTNTFTLNRISIETRKLNIDLHDNNLAAVNLAQKASDNKQLVYGNLGPTGKMLEPYGDYSEDQFVDNYAEQASILESGGVDGFIIQTMTDLREAVCALKACKYVSALPVIISLAYSFVSDGGRTAMGNTVSEATLALDKHGANVIGANCGDLNPYEMSCIVSLYKDCTTLPVIAQPNAGKPKLINGQTKYDMSPEVFADGVMRCLEKGAVYVGGCCGTTVEHIKAVSKRLYYL